MVLGLDSLEEDTVAHLGHLEQHLPLRHFLKEWSHLQRVTFAKSVHRWQVDLMTLSTHDSLWHQYKVKVCFCLLHKHMLVTLSGMAVAICILHVLLGNPIREVV